MTYKNTFRLLIAVLVVFILILLQQCNNNSGGHLGETVVDTLKITHIDTMYFEKTITKTETILDTIQVYEQSDGTFLYRYITDIDDSLIKGQIITDVSDSMNLLSQSINYTPKFPKYIYRTDSIIINKETWLEKPSRVVIGLGINSNFAKGYYEVGPSVELQLKDKVNVNIGYGVVNKGVTFGLHIPINNK